jgi:hypothetical protein
MASANARPMTFGEFLLWEQAQDRRHEFIDGVAVLIKEPDYFCWTWTQHACLRAGRTGYLCTPNSTPKLPSPVAFC